MLFIWLGEVSERFQLISKYLWYVSMTIGLLSMLSLIGSVKPSYYDKSMFIYHQSKIIFMICSVLILLPSKKFFSDSVAIALTDETIRTGFIDKINSAVKNSTNEVIDTTFFYTNYFKEKYFKYVYLLMYFWDLRKLKIEVKTIIYVSYAVLVVLSTNYILSFITTPLYFDEMVKDIALAGLIFLASTVIKILFIPSLDTVKQLLIVYIVEKINKRCVGVRNDNKEE